MLCKLADIINLLILHYIQQPNMIVKGVSEVTVSLTEKLLRRVAGRILKGWERVFHRGI